MTERVVDLRGLKCPLPVLKAKKLMPTLAVGERLTLECTDPMTVIDLPNYVRESGHRLERHEQRDGVYIFTIAKVG
ncbi:MAG: sulfurtransferase TusA family protein [Xanthobacteraceae bacterium]|nr:sulfurtransferase TusA family protein [Xanthobacteraceae bacterium]